MRTRLLIGLRQESVSLVTNKMTAAAVIPESGLVRVVDLTILTRVETWQPGEEIMETKTSKPWDTFLFSNKTLTLIKHLIQ